MCFVPELHADSVVFLLQIETVQAAADDRAAAAIELLDDEDDMQQVHPAVSDKAKTWESVCKNAFAPGGAFAPEAATDEEEVRLRIRLSYIASSFEC